MINNSINWIKNNKLLSLILLFFFFTYIFKPLTTNFLGTSYRSTQHDIGYGGDGMTTGSSVKNFMGNTGYSPSYPTSYEAEYYDPAAPQMDVVDRKVVTNSNMSLLVKDVRASLDAIEDKVIEKKGYVVNTNISSPETGTNGYIVVRVPDTELKETLVFLRELSVKVVYENISGQDITDQYMDIQERLSTLNSVKARYQEIMAGAADVDQIMNVQQKIFSTQDQIDRLTGQMRYMEGTSSSSLITVNLSTDELSLPYTPTKSWRPEVIFKQAVRSLVATFQDIGTALIWLLVYAPVWAPVLIVIFIIRRARKRKISQ